MLARNFGLFISSYLTLLSINTMHKLEPDGIVFVETSASATKTSLASAPIMTGSDSQSKSSGGSGPSTTTETSMVPAPTNANGNSFRGNRKREREDDSVPQPEKAVTQTGAEPGAMGRGNLRGYASQNVNQNAPKVPKAAAIEDDPKTVTR